MNLREIKYAIDLTLVRSRNVLILISFIIIILSLVNITYGLAIAGLFLGIGLLINTIANYPFLKNKNVKQILNFSAIILVCGGLLFYVLLLISTLLNN